MSSLLGSFPSTEIAHNECALLMELIGDELTAAPTLNEVVLEPREAKRLFEQLLFDIELMLELGWVHGDLSAHNILYQPGRIVLIDFPQVVSCQNNPEARAIFERDLERVAGYFSHAGVALEPRALARELWQKHVAPLDPSSPSMTEEPSEDRGCRLARGPHADGGLPARSLQR